MIILYLINTILMVLLVIIFIVFFLKIDIEITNLKVCYEDKIKNVEFEALIIGKIFGCMKIVLLKINTKRIRKFANNKYFRIDNVLKLFKYYKREYDEWPIEIKDITLEIALQIIDLQITCYIVVIISIILEILFAKCNNEDNKKYKIYNSYNDNFFICINLSIEGIITINLAHIINILIIMFKERRKLNGRKPSNRRSNEYNYG